MSEFKITERVEAIRRYVSTFQPSKVSPTYLNCKVSGPQAYPEVKLAWFINAIAKQYGIDYDPVKYPDVTPREFCNTIAKLMNEFQDELEKVTEKYVDLLSKYKESAARKNERNV